jgi:hypothetical protein
LFRLVVDHSFPSTSTVVGFASSIINANSPEKNKTKEVLNCLRVLQRVLPVIFEIEVPEFEDELLWKRETIESGNEEPVVEEAQFVIEDDDDEERPAATPTPKRPRPVETKPSLGERLFSCAIDLLFCCGFTLPLKIQVDHHKINYIIWFVAWILLKRNRFLTLDQGKRRGFHSRCRHNSRIRRE